MGVIGGPFRQQEIVPIRTGSGLWWGTGSRSGDGSAVRHYRLMRCMKIMSASRFL